MIHIFHDSRINTGFHVMEGPEIDLAQEFERWILIKKPVSLTQADAKSFFNFLKNKYKFKEIDYAIFSVFPMRLKNV